jgi:putative pyruvate formate lyase activating enzyme
VGVCGASAELEISNYGPHFGEERELVGSGGSGTIFFAHCGLRCSFCQNYEISHLGRGRRITTTELKLIMLELEAMGCANVNLVTPTHYVPQIVVAAAEATRSGFSLPIVYNCGGYESTEVLALLDGFVDVYLPDAKFADSETANRLCAAPDYPERMVAALVEMQRQVGDLRLGRDGCAEGGLLIRHLVMPGDPGAAARVFDLLAESVSRSATINVMGQYRPCGMERGSAGALGAGLTREAYDAAEAAARARGLSVLSWPGASEALFPIRPGRRPL